MDSHNVIYSILLLAYIRAFGECSILPDNMSASAELARQRDVNKYYQPWLDNLDFKKLNAVPVDSGPDDDRSTRCSNDTALTAFAQLAALRLNVKRGMVSLLDTKTQIVLAEATQTLSLVDERRHAPGDHIWLGNVTLPRGDCSATS